MLSAYRTEGARWSAPRFKSKPAIDTIRGQARCCRNTPRSRALGPQSPLRQALPARSRHRGDGAPCVRDGHRGAIGRDRPRQPGGSVKCRPRLHRTQLRCRQTNLWRPSSRQSIQFRWSATAYTPITCRTPTAPFAGSSPRLILPPRHAGGDLAQEDRAATFGSVYDRCMRCLLPLCLIAAFWAGALSTPLQAAGDPWRCGTTLGPMVVNFVDAADSSAMASAWLPAFTHLANAIPVLSPREASWLKEEEASGSAERMLRAIESRENSLNEARQNALFLQMLMQNIATGRDNAVLIRGWLKVVFSLLRSDWPYHLTRLVADRAIPREALPKGWEVIAQKDDFKSLQMHITSGRDRLSRDIVMCTLPSLGLGSLWDDQGRILAK